MEDVRFVLVVVGPNVTSQAINKMYGGDYMYEILKTVSKLNMSQLMFIKLFA